MSDNENNEGLRLINPDELPKRRRREEEDESSVSTGSGAKFELFKNKGNQLKVIFESSGRFTIPSELWFRDYTAEDITDLTMCRQDDLLETIVAILNKSTIDNSTNVADMTPEEFFEVLVGMKIEYDNGKNHTHRWSCSCQEHKEPNLREISSMPLDLTTLKYKSIEECEVELRERMRPTLESLSKEEYRDYLQSRYGDDTFYTIDEELEKIVIKEPIVLTNDSGDKYKFRLTRIRDLIKGYNLASQKFNGKIRLASRLIAKRTETKEDFTERKERMVEDLEQLKVKATMDITRALSLISKNGVELSEKEKIAEYKSLDRKVFFNLLNFTNALEYGIYDKRDLICDLCGKTEKEELQRKFTPIELLPLSDANTDDSPTKLPRATGSLVYFGQ